ncbi:MAG: isochorismatase family protein [Candidatus Saccharibacteria bacterium]
MAKHQLQHEDCVLLIIDLQDNLMKAMDQAEKVYKNTQLLIATCRQLSMPIVVTEQYPKGLGGTVAAIADHLGNHTRIEKTAFSACTEDTMQALSKLGRKQVLIVGSETHICVFQTVRDLIAAGYIPYVISDAVCSRYKLNYKNGIHLMQEEGGIITNAETVVFDLLKKSGTPQFKAISPLLK